MNVLVGMLLGVALVLASLFVVQHLKRRRDVMRTGAARRQVSRKSVRPGNPFAAVSIRPGVESSCEAVRQFSGQRYLAVRAPSLPVPGCDSGKCGCRYRRYADRRASDDDRRDEFGRYGGITPSVSDERRGRSGDRRRSGSR